MIIRKWKAYKGTGTPNGIKGEDWDVDMPSGKFIVISETIRLDDNSSEAIDIMKNLKRETIRLNLTEKKCDKCDSYMEKYPLPQHPKANRLGWTYRYICANNNCLDEYLSKE